MTLDELKIICNKYDQIYGEYCESLYEGEAVFEFVKEYIEEKILKALNGKE